MELPVRYVMLTGATGLLGRYLLRNLLLRGTPVAVLIRPTKIASVRQRVESLLRDIESELAFALPRPVILSGDLNSEGLALSAEDRSWAGRNVGSILHNAASLSFESKGEGHEPWISNVGGTENVLEFARQLKIRCFHHVSTAYVSGLRTGRCLESELDVGQEFGNDYERSKLRSETMVRTADWLDQPTVYRPAIIVGDSRTGFSSTFHGFYTPLKIVSSVTGKMDLSHLPPQSFVEVLGLKGHEQKNLVPVDWVSEVLVDLMHNPKAQGDTYHLTPDKTVSIEKILEIIGLSLDARAADALALEQPSAAPMPEGIDFLSMFVQQMETYRAYWRDDPIFDLTNTQNLAGHLACPTLDDTTLLRLCKFAIDQRFWWSKGDRVEVLSTCRSWIEKLPEDTPEATANANTPTLNLRSLGAGGGDWVLRYNGSQWLRCQQGVTPQASVTVAGSDTALSELIRGGQPVDSALRSGSVVVLGAPAQGRELLHCLAGN